MEIEIADSEMNRSHLEADIRRYATRPVALLIVDDIAQWAAEGPRDVNGNPAATSGLDGQTGDWGIVVRRSIDRTWVENIISRVDLRFPQTRTVLSTPIRFLQHLVLHELAHLENGWGQEREDDCDAWAFDKLMQSNPAFESGRAKSGAPAQRERWASQLPSRERLHSARRPRWKT